jgi:hypothetical protein
LVDRVRIGAAPYDMKLDYGYAVSRSSELRRSPRDRSETGISLRFPDPWC